MKRVKRTKTKKKPKPTINTKDVEIITLLTADNTSLNSSCNDVQLFKEQKDPVRTFNKKKRVKQEEKQVKVKPDILPSMSVRLTMGQHCEPYVYPRLEYNLPAPKGWYEAKRKRKELEEKGRKHFCKFEVVKVPSPLTALNLNDNLLVESPQISEAGVYPRKASVTKGAVYPTPPTQSLLELHKPKSGAIINVTKEKSSLPPEKVLPIVYRKPKRRSILREQTLSALIEGEEQYYEEEEYYMSVEDEEDEFDIAAEEHLKALRRKVSQASAATSFNSKDIHLEEEVSWQRIAVISKLVQTFREENELERKAKPKKRYRRGTLQSHSFTRLKQKTLSDICFKLVHGTIHQGDLNYTEVSRNNQGICMPIAAYCYAQIQLPKFWSDVTIDDVLDVGNRLYMDSIGLLHMHAEQRDLNPADLHKYVYVGDKKIRFVVEQPDIVGYIRSTDKRVYNITKGLKIFLQRNNAGILQANDLNVAIWKSGKKNLYFFDASARATDLCQERTGTAVLAKFSKFEALITVLLDKTDLGHSPFTISPLIVKKILGRNEKDEEVVVAERSNYNILNENRAVVQASFDLGDKCFEFTRNKQGVPMAIIALIYTRITPASNWRRRTVDKIMMIGNQLYVECSEAEDNVEIHLEDIPSGFSIGPYAVEIYIYANLFTDLMYKKGVCEFEKCLTEFLEKNCNAVVQIGKHTLAIWQQRNMYFVFDPYTRNNEGLKCRSGTGCVSMLANIDEIIDIVTSNFDCKDLIFRIHALKILRIHRDNQLSLLFPRGATMSEIPVETIKKTRIRRCKKRAIEKPVQIQTSEYAMMKISAGDSPGPSIYEIDENVQSITAGILPSLPLKLPPKSALVTEGVEKDLVADLDSASLSDTQIEPEKPRMGDFEEEIMLLDLDSFDATMDELEMQGEEEEGEQDFVGGGDRRIGYTMRSIYSQVKSISLESYHRTRSAMLNTDLTYNYKILPIIELPIKQKPSEAKVSRYYISPEEELKKESNYVECDDGCQIICGSENIENYMSEVDRVAPFVCLFGIALHEEMPIAKWRSKTIDFILKSGKELYDQNNETYNKIEDYTLQFPENEYRVTLEMLMDTYVGNDLFTNSMGIPIIKSTLESSVFKKYNSAIIITPYYVCGILLYNSLYYLIDCFGGHECGPPECEDETTGFAFVCRFKAIEDMIVKFMQTKNRWDNNASLEYVRFVINVPIIRQTNDIFDSTNNTGVIPPDGTIATVSTTQSQELEKANNFVDLPDNSQILRGTSNIVDYGEDVEFMAPFMSIMATCVAEKYSIVTWTKDIVNYVLQCGSELFKQSPIRFDQVSKIVIPKISLGSTDYNVEVDYLHDAIMNRGNLEKSLSRYLIQDCEWALIVTRYYACAVCVKNYLYYLYDPFGSNEVGFGEGLSNDGFSSLQRFKDLHSMVMRILYNKNKREFEEVVEHTKFVLSSCRTMFIQPEQEVKKRKGKDDVTLDDFEQPEDGDEEEEGKAQKPIDQKKDKKKVNKVGYQRKGKFEVIQATNVLEDRNTSIGNLKDDHFVCLVALLNVITTAMPRWDTKRVDNVIDQGKQIYSLADDLNETNKRIIKNILIGSHLFDVIVKKIKIEDWKRNKTLPIGMDTVLRKRRFCIIQFENCSYAIYRDEDDVYHLFDPYGWNVRDDKDDDDDENKDENRDDENKNDENKDDENDDDNTPKSCWIKFKRLNDLKHYVRDNIIEGMEGYTFYQFVVMSVRPAPKEAILSHKLNMFDIRKRRKGDVIGKPFYEQETWLRVHQLPWSLANDTTACGKQRRRMSSKWRNWDIEYPHDLFLLGGTIHQIDRQFDTEVRGKQTLCNIIIGIAMTNIYELEEWNSSVVDSIVNMGNDYFKECIEGIDEENYEIQISDLKDTVKLPPFVCQIEVKSVVEGTMFLINEKKFNLYKALRYFFDHYETRCGIICAIKGESKKFLGFAKLQENEYFIFDCQSYGPPMFKEKQGVAYALRCLKFNRLLYCLVATLRGGDFYIFEVETYNFRADDTK